MLQRQDDVYFWQSVTGSLEKNETPRDTALREVLEETGIDIVKEGLDLIDCHKSIEFEIFPQFRYRYAPDVSKVKEHWFLLPLNSKRIPQLAEHQAYRWLSPEDAAQLTKSWNNAEAILAFL
ncbi:dATP pyrophosphohydrolase [Actinobacillus delphinicola]|uniref:dATP pyrophosphohydrolase n=2 Tax=Actinobacillus delphinicola TaxID=51161 RepID=A0A448TTP2_9PAST|nr:dATP pyrophosphohydrolase [Actinobacillus delphinicola]